MLIKKSLVTFDESKIDRIFSKLNQCVLPGAAVGIAIDGNLVYRKAFGLASMELPTMLSTSMRMRIGSTTKHFASLGYLLLCEDGKASLDDPVGKHIPELHAVSRNATMRQLMANTSGLRDACDLSLRFSGSGGKVCTDEILAHYREISDVNAVADSAWIYNNGGYVLLSIAIERIADQPLEEYFRRQIFEPAGMNDSLVRRFDTDFVPNSAALHMMNLKGQYEKLYFGIDFAGAGAIVSTVDDMLRWLAHMDEPTVGTVSSWSAIRKPQTLANGTSTGYGLGLMIGQYRGFETVCHPGGGMGSNAQMLKVPAAGLDVVTLVNRHDVNSMELVSQILDECLIGLEPPAEQRGEQSASGCFRSRTTGRVVQLLTKEGKQMVSIDGFDLPYVRGSDGLFRPISIWSFLKRTVELIGDPHEPRAIRISDFGNTDELTRIPAGRSAELTAAEGRYRCDASGTEARVCMTEQGPRLITQGRFGSAPYELESLGEGTWRARPATPMNLGGIVSLNPDNTGFRFFTYGTRALPFRRLN